MRRETRAHSMLHRSMAKTAIREAFTGKSDTRAGEGTWYSHFAEVQLVTKKNLKQVLKNLKFA